jgi:Cu+-exporting ATPase
VKAARTRFAVCSAFGLFAASAAFAVGPDKTTTPVKPAPAHCAVTDEVITDPADALKTTYNGKTYLLCCAGCKPEFAKNPAKNAKVADLRGDIRAAETKLADLKAALADAQKQDAPKKAAAPAPAEAVASTAVYCAITDETIASPAAAKGTASLNGKTYYFCCPGCKTKFDKDPAASAKAADERAAKRAVATVK